MQTNCFLYADVLEYLVYYAQMSLVELGNFYELTEHDRFELFLAESF